MYVVCNASTLPSILSSNLFNLFLVFGFPNRGQKSYGAEEFAAGDSLSIKPWFKAKRQKYGATQALQSWGFHATPILYIMVQGLVGLYLAKLRGPGDLGA